MADKSSVPSPGPTTAGLSKSRITPQQAKYRANIEEAFATGNLTVVVGAGVSISAIQASKRMSGNDLARVTESMSWLGVLRHGLDYLEEEDILTNLDDTSNLNAYKNILEAESIPNEDILRAASFLKRKLVDSGKLDSWFDLEFEGIYQKCLNHDPNPILDAMRELYHGGARIITTNYDDLLEKHIGGNTIVSDGTLALKMFFRKRNTGICHVHGIWWHSKGTVLDTMDYERVVQNESLQQDLKNSMSSSEVLLFVGTGAGLDDPNFGHLLAWAAKQNDGLTQRHCVLARHGQSMDTKSNGLNVLRYGAEFGDLPVFITEMVQKYKRIAPPKNHYLVPSNQVAHFVGREDILTSIKSSFAVLEKQSRPVTLILQAMGGQGKSQLALEHCRRSKPNCLGIFWINATSETTAERDIEIIASKLNTPLKRALDDVSSKIEFVKETLESWKEPWMLIFDNYDWPAGFQNIKDFIPSRGKGSILVTSRDRAVGRLGELIPLPPMTDDEGVELLKGKYYGEETGPDRLEALNVVERLGHLPLAISQARSYIEHEKISPSQFLVRYEAERMRVMKHIPKEFWEYKKIDIETEKEKAFSVFTTWEMSFQQIQTRGDQSKFDISHFLTVCSFLEPSKIGDHLFIRYQEKTISPPSWIQLFISDDVEGSSNEELSDDELVEDDIPTFSKDEDSLSQSSSNLKAETWSSESYWDIITDLEGISLLKSVYRGKDGGVFIALHPFIHDWLQLRITKAEERRLYIEQARDVLHTSILNMPSTLGHKRELLSHVEAYISYDERFCRSRSTLEYERVDGPANDFRNFYHDQGRYSDAKRLCSHILKRRKELLGTENSFTISAMGNLARTYAEMGETIKARELEEQVLELRTRVSGKEHPNTILAMGNLAITYADMGETIKAKELEEQVLELRTRVSGKEHPSTILAMGTLARIYADIGETIKARELEKQVLELRTRVSGKEHPDTILAMGNLATTYAEMGETIKARELEEQVLKLRTRISGKEHPGTILAMGNLAITYADMGETIKARELGEQVLELRTSVSGKEHPGTIVAMGNLAITYADIGETIKARELEEQVLELRTRVLGKEHPNTILAMGNLATNYANMGETIKARELGEQVLELRTRVLGKEHPDTILAMGNLATTYADLGETIKARKLEEQVLELRTRVSGKEHPGTILAMGNLATTYADLGETIKAKELKEQVLELRTRVSGKEHPSTILAMGNLARTYANMGETIKARELEEQVLELRTRVSGKEHPSTILAMGNLAITYADLGETIKARELEEQILELRKRTSGEEPSCT